MSAEIRRHQTTLICSGLAVIAFGFWSIVRALLVLWFNMTQIRQTASAQMPEEGVIVSVDTVILITVIGIFVMLILDLFFRLYVGFAAVAEGNGKPRRIRYIVYSVLFLVFSVSSQVMLFVSSAREELTVKIFVTLFIEISSNIAFVEIIRSSLAIRRLTGRKNKEREEIHAA